LHSLSSLRGEICSICGGFLAFFAPVAVDRLAHC
jgi:hypothetical protein